MLCTLLVIQSPVSLVAAVIRSLMEPEDAEKSPGAKQEEVSRARSAAETTSPQRSGTIGVTSTGQSPGIAGCSLSDLEHQRRLRLHPAAAAVHLVPDIIVEHVSPSTSDIGTSGQPLFGLSPGVLEPGLSTGRQFRTLSDTSVYQMDRCCHSSAVATFSAARPVHSSWSPGQFSPVGVVKFTGDDTAPPELDMEVFSSEGASLETLGSTSRHYVEQPVPVSVMWPIGSPYWQPPLPSTQSLGPERSPKGNWLRRHSDSNLTWQAGLRVEPYPIRSRSTGDTLLSVVSLCEQPVSSAAEAVHTVLKEQIPDSRHSEQQQPVVPSHLWSTAGSLWQERASPTAKKFFSEGSKQPVAHAEELQQSGRSCSEKVLSREFSSQSDKTSAVERRTSRHIAETDISAVASTSGSTGQTGVVDMSVRERDGATKRTEGLVEKRMKLKKYLQTRYQMSQHELRQSSDTDDVFTERVLTPDRSALVTEVSEPEDLSARSHLIPTAKPVSDTSERAQELDRETYFSVSPSSQEPAATRIFDPSSELGHLSPQADEMPQLVKHEPSSPGIVPSGTSVFVFPPALPAHHESAEWYHTVLHRSGSPVPSPLSSAVSECYHPVGHLPRFFRHPSYPGEESPYRATGLRMGYQHMPPLVTDVGAMCHRRACSLAISTRVSPLTLSEALPTTAQDRRTVAGPEMMSVSARLSLAEPFPRRLQSGSQWQHHRVRGRQSSSTSAEDPANFTCPACSLVFTSYQRLAEHMVDHVSTSPPPPPLEPGEHSEAETTGLEATGGQKAVHLCPICQRSFSRGDMLTRHVRLHTGIRPYECTLCSQVFSRSDHLTTHQRTHTGEKPYRCPLCEYAAPRRDMVTRHTRIHESSSSVGHGGGGRRGRRAGSSSSDRGSAGHPVRSMYGRTVQGRRSWRHRSDSSGFASRQHWSPTTCDDLSSSSSSFQWSLASSSVDSTDSAVVMVGPRPPSSTTAGRGSPVTCRAWSTTSAESFESYPGAAHHRSSLSSAPCDSPDVFVMHPRYFRWGVESSSGSEATMTMGSSTNVSINVGKPSPDASDVAGLRPALQKCSVTSPGIAARDQSTHPE